jgi:predicted nucleic acid-binding Zn ribbon protein
MSDTRWRRKKQRKTMLWVVLIAILFAVGVGAAMFLLNSRNPHS